ncbi:MAG: bifunctional riboflavin kinase/FAD synthetase [PVC group bacterium]|nr:bifunctional riboflavin kinase/FAD synthetase [PVC group bacterium]
MEIISGLSKFKKDKYQGPLVVAIGTFDGVHLAHQAIISAAVKKARELNGTSIILTFSPHPLKVTNPQKTPALLTSLDHRIRLISELNADVCLIANFRKWFSGLTPEAFCEKILKDKISAAWIVVGEKFNFGNKKSGDIENLKSCGKRFNYKVEVLPLLADNGFILSSSLIRRCIETGHLEKAETMLGRQFSVLGTVKKGSQRGNKLGFPTANIDPHQEAVPPEGVYAVKAVFQGTLYDGMLNIGTRPTFDHTAKEQVIELHIFDFDKNIYKEDIEVFFIEETRKEKHFSSPDLLRKQIAKDAVKIRKILQK